MSHCQGKTSKLIEQTLVSTTLVTLVSVLCD